MKKTTFAAILLCTFLAGCGQQAAQTDSTSTTAPETTAAAGESTQDTTMARITAIDGDSITFESMGGGMRGQGGGNQQGEKPTGDASADAGTPPTDGNVPTDGDAPQGGGKGMHNSEAVTATMAADCTIMTEADDTQTTASASDLAVGDMVEITYAQDGISIQNIVIKTDAQQDPTDTQPTKDAAVA